jgi:hypothetical protein
MSLLPHEREIWRLRQGLLKIAKECDGAQDVEWTASLAKKSFDALGKLARKTILES